MRYEIFSIKDCVAGTFGAFMLFNNTAVAERWFDSICRDSKDVAKDLQLFKLGYTNLETGDITSCVTFVKSGVITDEQA